jgi:hypothetical protein
VVVYENTINEEEVEIVGVAVNEVMVGFGMTGGTYACTVRFRIFACELSYTPVAIAGSTYKVSDSSVFELLVIVKSCEPEIAKSVANAGVPHGSVAPPAVTARSGLQSKRTFTPGTYAPVQETVSLLPESIIGLDSEASVIGWFAAPTEIFTSCAPESIRLPLVSTGYSRIRIERVTPLTLINVKPTESEADALNACALSHGNVEPSSRFTVTPTGQNI